MLPCGTYNATYAKDMAIVRTKTQWGLTIGGLILLFCLPLFTPSSILSILIIMGITIISVHGLNILTGLCGQLNFGQAAFMGVGAYTCAYLMIQGIPWPVALICGALMSGLIGLVFGLPSLRLKGFYLAMATIAAQFILSYTFVHLTKFTRGSLGLAVPIVHVGDIALKSEASLFWLIMAFMVIMTFFAKNIMRTRAGRAFVAIRDNDLAAEILGINLTYYKCLAFFVCCFYAGVAGSLWAFYFHVLVPEHFTFMDSIWQVGMLIVGGMGSTLGVMLGVVFIRAISEGIAVLSPKLASIFPQVGGGMGGATGGSFFIALGSMLFGLIIILFLIYEPRGLAHRWEIFKATYRLRPFPY